MNWTLPGQGTAPESEFWNTDEGMRALYQNMADYFSGSGNQRAMAGWFSQMFPGIANAYKAQAATDPNLRFENWLLAKAPGLFNQFGALPREARGSRPDFVRPSRQLW